MKLIDIPQERDQSASHMGESSMDPIVAVLSAIVGTAVLKALESLTSRSVNKSVTTERDRLQSQILGSATDDRAGHGQVRGDGPAAIAESESERFAKLLIEYYAHGLAQAKRSSVASLVSSGVGLAVLIGGVSMAVIGSLSAAVVVSVSGVVTNAVGVLFHRQADNALRHMEAQTLNLRSDMRSEREAAQAIQLMDNVDDSRLRDQLRTAVILRLANAQLPEMFTSRPAAAEPHGSSVAGLPESGTNGQGHLAPVPAQHQITVDVGHDASQ